MTKTTSVLIDLYILIYECIFCFEFKIFEPSYLSRISKFEFRIY